MDRGIRFKLIWADNDLLEISLSAWNGEFGGIANIYLGHGELIATAESLRGFPQSPKDERKVELGDANPDGFGWAKLHLFTVGMVGHAVAELSLRTSTQRTGDAQTVTLQAQVEAAAIDDFVIELSKLEDRMDSTAFLKINP